MSPAIAGGLVMLAVLAAVFVLASFPGRADGWAARLGRGGLVAVLLALGVAIVGVSIVMLPEALVVGTALLVAGLLLVAIAALGALRGRPSPVPRVRSRGPRGDVPGAAEDDVQSE